MTATGPRHPGGPLHPGGPMHPGGPITGVNGWAAPDGSADDTAWRRPTDSTTAVESRSGKPGGATAIPPQYQGPPRMHRPSAAVGWGPVITSGPTPRALPYQDHEALDREDAQARAVTVGVGVLTLVVLFLLLLMMVIRAGTTTGVA